MSLIEVNPCRVIELQGSGKIRDKIRYEAQSRVQIKKKRRHGKGKAKENTDMHTIQYMQ